MPAHADNDLPRARIAGSATAAASPAVSATQLFCEWLQRSGVGQVLDLGGSVPFGKSLRRGGYAGALFSVEPTDGGYRELLAQASADPLWFPLARQGAGAGAYFTQLDGERVFIQAAARVLRDEVMGGIEALRVDTQALQAGVLDSLSPLLEGIRLILVEPAGAGVSAAGIVDVALRQLEALAFERLPGAAGTEQHGSFVLLRSAQEAPPSQSGGISLSAIVTSVGGKLERRLPDGSDIGLLWLQSCMQSWQHTAANVVSVAEREPPPGLRWAQTPARPSLAQMLGAVPIEAGRHLILTNADIVLTDAWPALLPRLHGQAVYYGSRLEVERGTGAQAGLAPRGIYEMGFDVFLLPESFVREVLAGDLLPTQLRIGEPWWDYLLPVLALARGFPLKKFGGPVLAMHYVHPARYSDELWARNRQLFIEVCSRLLADPHCHATGVLTELLAHPEQLSHLVCRCLP